MGQIILHMELEHCCPELIMMHATHWQVPSQISLGKVQSLHFSNKKSSQHPYRHMEAYIDENISSITDQYLASSGAVSPPLEDCSPEPYSRATSLCRRCDATHSLSSCLTFWLAIEKTRCDCEPRRTQNSKQVACMPGVRHSYST
jgi:hypothetical protein